MIRIKFKGEDFYTYREAKDDGKDAPIFTREQYESFSESFAHIYQRDNEILRFGVKIGDMSDIVWGEYEKF